MTLNEDLTTKSNSITSDHGPPEMASAACICTWLDNGDPDPPGTPPSLGDSAAVVHPRGPPDWAIRRGKRPLSPNRPLWKIGGLRAPRGYSRLAAPPRRFPAARRAGLVGSGQVRPDQKPVVKCSENVGPVSSTSRSETARSGPCILPGPLALAKKASLRSLENCHHLPPACPHAKP